MSGDGVWTVSLFAAQIYTDMIPVQVCSYCQFTTKQEKRLYHDVWDKMLWNMFVVDVDAVSACDGLGGMSALFVFNLIRSQM